MRQYTLDSIVRKKIFNSGKTIHDYVEYLSNACDCLRELTFDSIQTVKSVKLTVNSYKAVTLPTDYVDFIKVGYPRGQYVVEMTQTDSLNRLNNFDTDLVTKIVYTGVDQNSLLNYNLLDVEAPLFNHNVEDTSNKFKVLRERNEIQLDNRCDAEFVILDYIGDGLDTDAETSVHPYCISTIDTYMDWKASPNRNNIQSPEGFNFHNHHRLLRGRFNDITLQDIFKSKSKGFTQVIKN